MTPTIPKRVLVVDDAVLVRMFYRDLLERAGFVVEEALNGIEAMERALTTPFDLLVVDVNMPRMDGLTFVSTLRQQPLPISGIPVLITSTEAAAQDRSAARHAGANYYLTKPIRPDVFAHCAALLCGVDHG